MSDGEARHPRVGVGAVVVRDGRVLLMRRRGEHGGGTWSTPGGYLDPGESPADCAARELREEVGVEAQPLDLLAVTNDVFSSDRHFVTLWWRCRYLRGEPRVVSAREVAEVGWYAPDDLPDPFFLSFANLVAGRSHPANAWQRGTCSMT